MIPPWTVPPDFLRYMQAGAETGLSAGRLAQAGQQAAAHIALAGQQLASENERAKERNALTQQDLVQTLLERSRSADLMKQFHDAEIGERMRHNLVTESTPKSGFKSFELGKNSKVGHYDPATGKFVVDFDNSTLPKPGELDKAAIASLTQSLKHWQAIHQRAVSGLSKSNLDDETKKSLNDQIAEAKANMDVINYKLNPASAPTADNSVPGLSPDQAFQFPSGLKSFGNEGGLFPSVNPNVLAPIPAGGGLPSTPQLIWDHKTGTLQPAQ